MKPFGKSFILCYMELMQIYVKMPVLWRHGRISTTPYIITPQLRRGHNSGYQNKWIFQLQDCDPCKLFTNKLYVHLGLQRQKWILPNLANQQTLQFTSFLFFFFLISLYFLTLQYCIGFAIYQNESATGIHVFPILNPPPSPYSKTKYN